ncbi:hypothetical protein Tco_0409087 [Tanacetum coccineum]
MMAPPGFSTPPQIPNITTSKRPPATTIVFVATTLENTPFAYRASTSTNPNPMISPAFVEENYEILESLLREQQRQTCNEDLRTELEYLSEDYDEEREMEPRPEPRREATPTLRLRSPGIHRQRERVVGFEDAPNGEGMPKVSGLLRLKQGKPSAGLVYGQAPNFPFQTQIGNPPARSTFTYHPKGRYMPQDFTNNSVPSYNRPMHPTVTPSSSYPFYTQSIYAPPNIPAYPNLAGPFADSAGSVTPFV